MPNDIGDIMVLTSLCAQTFDDRDADAYADCWTEDAVFERSSGDSLRGREELAEYCRHGASRKGRHVITNSVIEVDRDSAKQRCYLQYLDRENDFGLVMFAMYDDELVRQDGRWRFTVRRVTRDVV